MTVRITGCRDVPEQAILASQSGRDGVRTFVREWRPVEDKEHLIGREARRFSKFGPCAENSRFFVETYSPRSYSEFISHRSFS